MTTPLQTFDTKHNDIIHDAKLDYYGKKLATCSSDKTIMIFEIVNNEQKHLTTLNGHRGPVWQVDWAHPRFGSFLASCSYDNRVLIWKENDDQKQWQIIKEIQHEASVNSIAWAPHDLGLCLASVSSDSTLKITSLVDSQWVTKSYNNAHNAGCNAVSWAPASQVGSLTGSSNSTGHVKRLVTGGCDNQVSIWTAQENGEFIKEANLTGHSDWVRDVAWSPNIGLPYECIASASQDKTVNIWTKNNNEKTWNKVSLPKFGSTVWRVSWSFTGNMLAVTTADNKVTMWKEDLEGGEWKCVSNLN
mmetsp:Transcript_1068/g.1658  ORF Transcript_1068/g.1658 Transcript_1068/m.1658 type:complete len:303 (-) Transcript_1068:39-947(-)